jgi:hypothetical protein
MFRQVEGDPRDLVISLNLQRQDVTPGQRAMLAAMVYPPDNEFHGENGERLRIARTILPHKSLVPSVIVGALSLADVQKQLLDDEAPKAARAAKRAALRLRYLALDDDIGAGIDLDAAIREADRLERLAS